MRTMVMLGVAFLAAGCGRFGGVPAIAAEVSILSGKSPTKVVDGVGAKLYRYQLEQPISKVVASLKADATKHQWVVREAFGHPVYVSSAAGQLSSVYVEPGRLSDDGMQVTEDQSHAVVSVTQTPANPN